MSYRRSDGRRQPAETSNVHDAEAYRLVAIRSVPAPEGCGGHDWLVYQIAQGHHEANVITGYRRGDLHAATADVEKIVLSLNERRMAGNKERSGSKHKTSAPLPSQ